MVGADCRLLKERPTYNPRTRCRPWVRADGTVKVLDFGLAKAIEQGGIGGTGRTGGTDEVGRLSMSPTITTPAMTQAGMLLGTAAYMSPEQARGAAVDKRADIWAFGV